MGATDALPSGCTTDDGEREAVRRRGGLLAHSAPREPKFRSIQQIFHHHLPADNDLLDDLGEGERGDGERDAGHAVGGHRDHDAGDQRRQAGGGNAWRKGTPLVIK